MVSTHVENDSVIFKTFSVLQASTVRHHSIFASFSTLLLAAASIGGCADGTGSDHVEPNDSGNESSDTTSDQDLLPYRYLLVRDYGDATSGSTESGVGVVIDAIYLRKGTTHYQYATEFHAVAFGQSDEDTRHRDASNALGEPNCDLDEDGYVNLGGRGGFLVVSFEDDIEPGDALVVLGCFPQGGRAARGDYAGLVGQNADPNDPAFVPCLSDETGGDCVFELPAR